MMKKDRKVRKRGKRSVKNSKRYLTGYSASKAGQAIVDQRKLFEDGEAVKEALDLQQKVKDAQDKGEVLFDM